MSTLGLTKNAIRLLRLLGDRKAFGALDAVNQTTEL